MKRHWPVLVLISIALSACHQDGGTPQAQAPVILSVSPRIAVPGDVVTVTGEHLKGAALVIAGQPVNVTAGDDTRLTAVLPPLDPGDYDVQVTTAGGRVEGTGPSVLPAGEEGVVQGHLLVRLPRTISTNDEAAAFAARYGFTLQRFIPALMPGDPGACGGALAEFVDNTSRSTAEAANALDGAQTEAEADPVTRLNGDAYPTAEPDPKHRWELSAVNAQPAFDLFGGPQADLSGVTVAVLDTGVTRHPEFFTGAFNNSPTHVLSGRNFTLDNPPVGGPDINVNTLDVALYQGQTAGHGTGVAAIIGAPVGNVSPTSGLGQMVGVAPNASVLPVKVCDESGACTGLTIAAGVCYAISQHVNVINLSLGGPAPSRIVRDALAEAAAQGIVTVAAAGNEELARPHFPAAYSAQVPGLMAVAAVNANLAAAGFSNRGGWVSVAAPGEGVWTANVTGRGGSYSYQNFDGTSFAAPYVAGAAALLRAQHADWTPEQIRARIVGTARNVGCAADACGAGLLDVGSAVGAP